MNLRETGSRGARRLTTALGVGGAALASIIGVSVWAGTSAAVPTGTTTVQGGSGLQRGDDDSSGDSGQGLSNSGQGFVNPGQGLVGSGQGLVGSGQGGGGHASSSGS